MVHSVWDGFECKFLVLSRIKQEKFVLGGKMGGKFSPVNLKSALLLVSA